MAMNSIFEIFNPIGSLFYASSQSALPPFPAEENQFLSITFSSLGPKVSLIFHKMYYLTVLMHFVSIAALIFDPIDYLFH